jgi:general secretion pathway protein I
VSRSPQGPDRGFTLLEILAALLVLAIVGGALLQLFQGGLGNVALSADYTRAALLARSKLAELEVRERFVPEEQGRFDERFRWHLLAADYVGPDGTRLPRAALEPVAVALSVLWSDGRVERRYGVQALFLARPREDAM